MGKRGKRRANYKRSYEDFETDSGNDSELSDREFWERNKGLIDQTDDDLIMALIDEYKGIDKRFDWLTLADTRKAIDIGLCTENPNAILERVIPDEIVLQFSKECARIVLNSRYALWSRRGNCTEKNFDEDFSVIAASKSIVKSLQSYFVNKRYKDTLPIYSIESVKRQCSF